MSSLLSVAYAQSEVARLDRWAREALAAGHRAEARGYLRAARRWRVRARERERGVSPAGMLAYAAELRGMGYLRLARQAVADARQLRLEGHR